MALPAGTYDVKFLQGGITVKQASITINESETPATLPVELRATPSYLQWRGQGELTWANLVSIEELSSGGSALEMQEVDGMLQWRSIGDETWIDLVDISAATEGTPQSGHEYTTADHGVYPSGSPSTDRFNLQDYIDTLKTTKHSGVIKAGNWQLNSRLVLHDGLHLRGEGMLKTIIDCPTGTWTDPDGFSAMELEDDGTENALNGIFLSDFCVIGADKGASDNGSLINLRSMYDFELKRLKVVDGSSYGIFVAGYGVGSFTNDITSEFWNSAHRGVITQCVTVRGQVGIGCEGGAEGISITRNHIYDAGLHGIRLASAYSTTIDHNTVNGAINGIWIDRHKNIRVLSNFVRAQRGVVWGGFNASDIEKSDGLIISGNDIVAESSGMTDAYHGDSDKNTINVTIVNNIVRGGAIRLLWSKNVNIQGNTSPDDDWIYPSHSTTGIVGNNLMRLYNPAAGIINIGNNIRVTDIPVT